MKVSQKLLSINSSYITLSILTSVFVYFITILLWPCYESLILIFPFVLLLLQIDHGHFIKSLHQKAITSSYLVFVVDYFRIFNLIVEFSFGNTLFSYYSESL